MGRRMRWEEKVKNIHPSHKMSKESSEARSPCGTPRWYKVSACKVCGLEYSYHSAGKFFEDGLMKPCPK